jgi:predicted transcriptional regulator
MSRANLDIIPRLYALAVAAEVSVCEPSRQDTARVARDAAAEISRLRRRIEELEASLDKLGRSCA